MIIALVAVWFLGGLVLALGVGATVRVADARSDWCAESVAVEPEALTAV